MKAWAGRRVQQLIAVVLEVKGTVCHLCGLDGANSADHDPPRSVLIAAGVPDPDALEYLFPSHRYPCNVTRKARPITEQLRAELLTLRRRYLERLEHARALSPRLARRRPSFERSQSRGRYTFPRISTDLVKKNPERAR